MDFGRTQFSYNKGEEEFHISMKMGKIFSPLRMERLENVPGISSTALAERQRLLMHGLMEQFLEQPRGDQA